MIQFDRSQDYELVRKILTHPRIYDKISDDFSPARDDYRPIEHDAVWYVIVRESEDGALFGLWMFHPQNGICWEVHTALLPIAYGVPGRLAAQLLPSWIWKHTPCRRIVTNVPSTNRLALRFAIAAGMKIFGINRASYLKGGKLCDQICLGISAPQEMADAEALPALDSIEGVLVGPEDGNEVAAPGVQGVDW